MIDATHARSILADLKERKDLVQMTFENNTIVDIKGMCEVFKALKSFEKLESLNFRCNTNFNDDVIAALAEGINLKKELRVSYTFHFMHKYHQRANVPFDKMLLDSY